MGRRERNWQALLSIAPFSYDDFVSFSGRKEKASKLYLDSHRERRCILPYLIARWTPFHPPCLSFFPSLDTISFLRNVPFLEQEWLSSTVFSFSFLLFWSHQKRIFFFFVSRVETIFTYSRLTYTRSLTSIVNISTDL